MNRLKTNTRYITLLIASIVVLLDQITKYWSTLHLSDHAIQILPGFDLVLRHNTGAAFSFLAQASGWQRWFFIILAIISSIGIVIYVGYLKTFKQNKQELFALSLILGGALGNLIDRLLYGSVVDFILWYYKHWEWPAFNIADSAICIGMILWLPSCFKK